MDKKLKHGQDVNRWSDRQKGRLICLQGYKYKMKISTQQDISTRGPKGHISCTRVQCADFFGESARTAIFVYWLAKNTNLVEDIEILLLVNFRWILFSSFMGEVKNVSAKQRPGRLSCFSAQPITRGPKGHCRSPENNERIKKLTSEWNKK